MKKTAIAPSNIAFVKYWGRKDETLRLPENGSVSMNCSNLLTTTTVDFSDEYTEDSVEIDGEMETKECARVMKHLDRIRNLAGIDLKAKVVSKNNFPSKTGLSSSASGFAALTVAGASAAGLELSEKEMAILARQGSGSACRSIPDGFCEWKDGDTSEESFSESIFSVDHWDLCDIVAVVSTGVKDVSTTKGHTFAGTSVFYEKRLSHMREKVERVKELLVQKNFTAFGEFVETEALELHAIMITSIPSLIYLQPGSLTVMKHVKQWREEGLECYFTVNTGQDIHVLCQKKDEAELHRKLSELECVRECISNDPAPGTRLSEEHLF